MGRQETFSDQDWRLEQLMFLFNHGLCEMSNVGIELARKYIFYLSLSIYIYIYIYTFFKL